MTLKTLQTDLETFFVEHILDAMANLVPIGFLRIWKIQYMIGSVFSFSAILKPRRLVYSVFFSIISSQLLLALQ